MNQERKAYSNPEIGIFNGEPILPPSSRDKKLTAEDLRTTYPPLTLAISDLSQVFSAAEQ